MNKEFNSIIKKFKLTPHPEGGFFRETYRSDGIIPDTILPDNINGDRNFCTGIYFLLSAENFSAFHRIRQDEMWHFYSGTALKIHMISPSGVYSEKILGNQFEIGEIPQFTVPSNYWFAAEVLEINSFAFVGCTVSPGFDFKDFELAKKKNLLSKYPEHQEIIERLSLE